MEVRMTADKLHTVSKSSGPNSQNFLRFSKFLFMNFQN